MRRIFAILIALTSLTAAAFTQKTGVAGTFFDRQGAVIPGVDITAIDSAGKAIAASTSGPEGEFLLELPVGTYLLEVGSRSSLFCRVTIRGYRVVNTRTPMSLDVLLGESASSHGGDRCKRKVIKF